MAFDRALLPKPLDYYVGLKLAGWHVVSDSQARACCPFHGGKNKTSLSVSLDTGAYHCFSCPAEGGGIIDFEMALNGGEFLEVADRLGALTDPLPHGQKRPAGAQRPTAKPGKSSEDEAAKHQKTREKIAETLAGASPAAPGDRVADYLASREIQLPVLPSVLYYHPALEYWTDPSTCIGTFPAMLAKIEDDAGEIIGLHRTYFDLPDDLPRKKTLGRTKGGIVRLYPELGRFLAVAEGLETSLSLRVAMPGRAVASALSAAGLAALPLPPDLEDLWIFADRDEGGAGQDAAMALASRAIAGGIRARVHFPPPGIEDFNDWLRSWTRD